MNETIERLEMKVAYLEVANTELSDAVYRQQKELDALREHLATLVGRFDDAQNKTPEWTDEDEKPPHY